MNQPTVTVHLNTRLCTGAALTVPEPKGQIGAQGRIQEYFDSQSAQIITQDFMEDLAKQATLFFSSPFKLHDTDFLTLQGMGTVWDLFIHNGKFTLIEDR